MKDYKRHFTWKMFAHHITLAPLSPGYMCSSCMSADTVPQVWPRRCSHATSRLRRVSRGRPRLRWACRRTASSSCRSKPALGASTLTATSGFHTTGPGSKTPEQAFKHLGDSTASPQLHYQHIRQRSKLPASAPSPRHMNQALTLWLVRHVVQLAFLSARRAELHAIQVAAKHSMQP